MGWIHEVIREHNLHVREDQRSPQPWRQCPGCKRQWPELVVQTHERDPELCAAYART